MPRRSIDKAAPKVHEGKDEVNEQDRQMDTMSSHVSPGIGLNLLKFIRWSVKSEIWDDHVIAARDLDFEFDVAFEGRNHSAHLVKPSAMLRNIRVQIPRHPSLLDRRGSSFCMSFFSSFAMNVRQVNFKYAYMKLTGSVYLLCAKLVPQIITINMWVHWMLSMNRDYPRSVKEIFASGVCLLRFLLLKMET